MSFNLESPAVGALPGTDKDFWRSVRAGEIDHWAEFLGKLLAGFDGAMALRLPDGSAGVFGRHALTVTASTFTLCLRHASVARELLLGRDPLRFAEAYFRGDIEVDGDLFAALSLKDHLHSLVLPLRDRMKLALQLFGRMALAQGGAAGRPAPVHGADVKSHSKQENRQAISFHYDVSNDFYRLWLGQGMVYSCAYFETPDASLEQAQQAKLDHICRKLQLAPGQTLLDIGCGWGSLVLHAARHYGVRAHGITLSERQFQLARERIREAGLGQLASVELRDYRDLPEDQRFDKIASVGMFEHVGLKNLPLYFNTVQRLLKPHGLFLNHGITHEEEGWGEAISSRFINRYVFPDGELDTVSNIQRVMERAKFEVVDVEALRPHYARTLRHWVDRLERQHDQALNHINEATYRVLAAVHGRLRAGVRVWRAWCLSNSCRAPWCQQPGTAADAALHVRLSGGAAAAPVTSGNVGHSYPDNRGLVDGVASVATSP